MTAERDRLEIEREETYGVMRRRDQKINELEIQVYQLKQRVEELERSQEESSAAMTQIKQSMETYRESAHTWEDKFHKSVMVREKAEKLAADMNIKIK